LAALAIAAVIGLVEFQRVPETTKKDTDRSAASGAPGNRLLAKSSTASAQRKGVDGMAGVTVEQFVEPSGSLKDNLAQLSRDAEAGSNAAAYYLATGLYGCRRVERGNQLAVSDSEGLPGFSADCRGLKPEDLGAFKHWLQLAADRGDIEAQVSYSLFIGDSISMQDALRDPAGLEDYKRRSVDYLNRAAASGSPAAFRRLSIFYADGVMVPQDYALAYAYRMAYVNATGASASGVEETYFSNLGVEEKKRARKLAQQLNSRLATH
jgi:hypothetical protein